MKTILVLVLVLSTGCSAVLSNRGSPFKVEECPTSFVPPVIDTVISVAAGVAAAKLPLVKNHDPAQTITIGSAVIFNISALMGLSEVYKCRQREDSNDRESDYRSPPRN